MVSPGDPRSPQSEVLNPRRVTQTGSGSRRQGAGTCVFDSRAAKAPNYTTGSLKSASAATPDALSSSSGAEHRPGARPGRPARGLRLESRLCPGGRDAHRTQQAPTKQARHPASLHANAPRVPRRSSRGPHASFPPSLARSSCLPEAEVAGAGKRTGLHFPECPAPRRARGNLGAPGVLWGAAFPWGGCLRGKRLCEGLGGWSVQVPEAWLAPRDQ